MSRRSVPSVVAFVGAAALLAGCQSVNEAAVDAEPLACPEGSECYDEVRPVGPGGELVVRTGEFFFDIEEGVALDGPVAITLINEGGALHNIRIDAAASDQKKVEAAAGETAEGVLELFGGTEYVYYCDIPGHRSNGMEGFLTVYIDEEAARAEGAFQEGAGEEEDGPGAGDNVGEDPEVPAEDAAPDPGSGAASEAGPGNTIAPTEPTEGSTESTTEG